MLNSCIFKIAGFQSYETHCICLISTQFMRICYLCIPSAEALHLTPGQAHDLVGADVLLADTQADGVLAENAYDAQERLIEPLEKAGKQIVIPPVARTGFSAAVIGLCTKLAT